MRPGAPERFRPPSTPECSESKEEFFRELEENTLYMSDEVYQEITEQVFEEVPLSGVAPDVSVDRFSEHEPLGYINPVIFVNKDYYKRYFDEDFSDMIPYDLEHERWEIYYATKKGLNPDSLDLNEGNENRYFGRSHRLAVRKALRLAQSEGNLDRYLEWYRIQFESFEQKGIKGPMGEFELVKNEAEKIRNRAK